MPSIGAEPLTELLLEEDDLPKQFIEVDEGPSFFGEGLPGLVTENGRSFENEEDEHEWANVSILIFEREADAEAGFTYFDVVFPEEEPVSATIPEEVRLPPLGDQATAVLLDYPSEFDRANTVQIAVQDDSLLVLINVSLKEDPDILGIELAHQQMERLRPALNHD